jgi:hypothetical protein
MKLKPSTVLPTPGEDAAITAAALDDPDCPPLTDAELAQFKPTRRLIEPDECAANMNGHRFGPHGPDGESQCEWCGEAPPATPDPADKLKNKKD